MTLPNPLQAAIFDLDGTLADTFPLIVDAWNTAVREPLGRLYTPEEVVARFGIPDAAMLRRELNGLPEPVCTAAVARYYAQYEAAHGMVTPFPGVDELLATLHNRGVCLGVVTGKGRRTAEITVRGLGWSDLFGSVITGEDVVAQKPDPEGVLKAAQQLGVEPACCLYAGDSPVDIEAGRAAGMFTVAAGWHGHYEERLRTTQPDFWAESPEELLQFLTSSLASAEV